MKVHNIYTKTVGLLLMTMAVLFSGCDADTEIDQTVEQILAAQPTIETIAPATADILTKITISGSYLNFAESAYIGDTECQITQRINGETLEIEVAANAVTGKVRIVTSAGKEAESPNDVTITYPTPTVNSTFPASAAVNENITIEGTNLESITRITFGDMEGTIQFQEAQAIVVSVPNNENSPVPVTYYYNSTSGEIGVQLNTSFTIVIPSPEVAQWPEVMARDYEVTLTGANMNLITGISVGGATVTLNTATETSVSFNVPSTVNTGFQDIVISYGTSGEVTQEDVAYINGQFESYIEFDAYGADAVTISSSADPLATGQLNGDVPQPPFPGDNYYSLSMSTPTGSTIGRLRLHSETNNDSWSTILDSGNFGDNPVLHFWINTENTEPFFKIYLGGTSSANRRQLGGSDINTGNEWKLYAVRLNDFIPGLTSVGSTFEFRLNTGSGASTLPVKLNMDWFIVTDSVLSELGAIDVTDLFDPAG